MTDEERLAERLRKCVPGAMCAVAKEAADALDAKDREIAELRLTHAVNALAFDLMQERLKRAENARPSATRPARDNSCTVVFWENHMMDFSQALLQIKAGHRMARTGWNGKDMFVFLVPGSTFEVNRPPLLGIYPEGTVIRYHPHIDMKTADGYVMPWLASQGDLLATDWVIKTL